MASKYKKILPLVMLGVGCGLLYTALWPIASKTVRMIAYPPPKLIDPTAVNSRRSPILVNSLGITNTDDLSLAGNWFKEDITLPAAKESPVDFFSLSYQKIELEGTPVKVNGNDLKNGALHFPGTALPGEYGNSVVFGHSALPQFYSKNNPLTVFNSLLEAKTGDEIKVKFDGILYRYTVRKITEVDAEDIEVLRQDFSRKELTLITCAPLGTYWKRHVVLAELVN